MIGGGVPNVLSIAGSDPSGGAGIQADLKTFLALGCHGMAALTALTAQNTRGISAIHQPPPDFIATQIRSLFADSTIAAIKIGMLGTAATVAAVSGVLREHPGVPIVLDPVLVATSGASLAAADVVEALHRDLIPLATLVTPNLAEAGVLAGSDAPDGDAAMEAVARHLAAIHPGASWLIKGGHAGENGVGHAAEARDLLLAPRGAPRWFSSPRLATRNTHGTGCTLSAAIAVGLARGHKPDAAIAAAKAYLDGALAGADRLQVGHGPGPVDHGWRWRS